MADRIRHADLVQFMEVPCYDETSLKMKVQAATPPSASPTGDKLAIAVSEILPHTACDYDPLPRLHAAARSAGIQKLVQTNIEFGMAVRLDAI